MGNTDYIVSKDAAYVNITFPKNLTHYGDTEACNYHGVSRKLFLVGIGGDKTSLINANVSPQGIDTVGLS